MAQSRGNKSRSNTSRASNQLMLIELKQRILAAINKLADRDTYQIATDDLEDIAQSLSVEGISVFLSCLYDTDQQQKAAVRKECVRLFGTLASFHDDLLAPHLSKIVINVVRRLRDQDSSIRDACVDTMGSLASRVLPRVLVSGVNGAETGGSASFAGPLGIFLKPLFDALSEQNRGVQVGAAMCLARVIESISDPSPNALQRLCPRIAKYLSSSNFTAKAAMLYVIGSIVQAGGAASHQCLAMLMSCLEEALKSTDWATRKAASETLLSLASSNGTSLGSFKSNILESLESCKFDKVKPVRDSVARTLQVWKSISTCQSDVSGLDKMFAVKENNFMEGNDSTSSVRKVDARAEGTPALKHSMSANFQNHSLDSSSGFVQERSAGNKISGINQKRRIPLSDKKTNPGLSKDSEIKDNIWQVEISVPHFSVPAVPDKSTESHLSKAQDAAVSREKIVLTQSSGAECLSLPGDLVCQHKPEPMQQSENRENYESEDIMVKNQVFEENTEVVSVKMLKPKSMKTELLLDSSLQQLREGGVGSWTGDAITSCSSNSCVQINNSQNDFACIRKQLCEIEVQQSHLIRLLQNFMSSSQESLRSLETRVSGMENVVNHLSKDIASMRSESGIAKCCGKLLPSDFLSSKFWKRNASFPDRHMPANALSTGVRVDQDSRKAEIDPEMDESKGRTAPGCNIISGDRCLENPANTWRVHVDVSSENCQKRTRNGFHVDGNLQTDTKLWERGNSLSKIAEGPSGRCIWEASKDESTLAPVRIAGDDGKVKIDDNPRLAIRLSRPAVEMPSEASFRTGGLGRGPFWNLWARALQFLGSGDVDSAYIEVLCAGDELLLVRLMSRTGPTLKQLSAGTTTELLRTIMQLLLQQSFVDVILPWIQQLADLAKDAGPECLGLSMDAKRRIVASLQEASTLEFPELWIAKKIDELTLQLAHTWCIIV